MEKEEEKLYIAKPKADKRHGFLSLAGAATIYILFFIFIKAFVATNMCLSREAYFYHDQTFVATKVILVAAPANDSFHCLTVV